MPMSPRVNTAPTAPPRVGRLALLCFLAACVAVYIIYYTLEPPARSARSLHHNTDLVDDGFCVVPLQRGVRFQTVRRETLRRLPPGYLFLDYSYVISGCSLTTFHRDITSSQRSYRTKHPTFTAILYRYDGDMISVCPGSHATHPLTLRRPVGVRGSECTLVVFNADLLHAGMINRVGQRRRVIQYKIAHADDVPLLSHLRGMHVVKRAGCDMSVARETCLRKLSYHASFLINTLFRPLLMQKYEPGTLLHGLQSMVPVQFYNNA